MNLYSGRYEEKKCALYCQRNAAILLNKGQGFDHFGLNKSILDASVHIITYKIKRDTYVNFIREFVNITCQ